MTDRIKAITVMLDKDYREDDVRETILPAIKMIKGVADAELHVADMDHYLAAGRARLELGTKIINLISEDRKNCL